MLCMHIAVARACKYACGLVEGVYLWFISIFLWLCSPDCLSQPREMVSPPSSSTHCVVDDQNQTVELTTVKKRQLQLQGGYECIFVENPPQHLQIECSVCLCILKEPWLVDCCGNRFCRTCIQPIQSQHKPCPLCGVPFTNSVVDKQLQRTLSNLQVFCSHKEAGCD